MNNKVDNDGPICIVQITRLGDLVQTYQAARYLKHKNTNTPLFLVARDVFAKPLMFLLEEIFDEVFLVNIDLDSARENSLSGMKDELVKLLDNINSRNIGSLVNLSWSKSSTYLCSLIEATNKFGLYRDNTNSVRVDDPWSQLVYSTVMRGTSCPFSLVDIYKSIIGANGNINSLQVSHNKDSNRIVIHPFASNPRKYWPSNKWIEVIYQTLKTHSDKEVVLVGSSSEVKQANDIISGNILKQYSKRIISKVGVLNIEELFSIVANASIFIGHDSFVSHLASLTTIPIVTISLGSARPHETSPYTDNAYIISSTISCYPCYLDDPCDLYQCHSDISYKVIAQAIGKILEDGDIDEPFIKEISNSVLTRPMSILKTDFSKSDFMFLKEMLPKEPTPAELFRVFTRISHLCLLSDIDEKHPLPRLTDSSTLALKEVLKGIEHLKSLSDFGKMYSMYILEEIGSEKANIDNIKEYSSKIDEVEELHGILMRTYPLLKPIVEFFLINRANLYGNSLIKLSESNFISYNNSSLMCSVIVELIDRSLGKDTQGEAQHET